jgi:hypothetical protein
MTSVIVITALPATMTAAQQQPSLKSLIEKKFTSQSDNLGNPNLVNPNVTVAHESPHTIILDTVNSNAASLWQAMDMVKDRGYTADQIMTYVSRPTSSAEEPQSHWIIFMSKK